MADFDARRMLDRYLYDYFMKKNLPELAKTFKNEANLEVDPNVPPAVDVPEGFLLEWWTVSCDFASFREWLNQRENPSAGGTQAQIDSQSGQFPMHSEINEQLLIDCASATMSNVSKSSASHERGKAPLAFSLSSHEEGLLTPNLGKCTPTNYASTSGQEPEPLSYATLRTANIGLIEETDPWLEILVNTFWLFEEKTQHDMLALGEKGDGSTSEATMTDDDTSGTSDCTSNLARLSTGSEVLTGSQDGNGFNLREACTSINACYMFEINLRDISFNTNIHCEVL